MADAWNLAVDRARGDLCKAFGPPSLVRQPGRIRIRWEDDTTLLLEFDAGTQTRRFHFALGRRPRGRCRGIRGEVVSASHKAVAFLAAAQPPRAARLEVVTTNLRAGYLRPNGVPYGERTVVKEFFDTFTLPEDGTWLIVTTVVSDPEYLTQEFVLSSQFRKETDASKWSPGRAIFLPRSSSGAPQCDRDGEVGSTSQGRVRSRAARARPHGGQHG